MKTKIFLSILTLGLIVSAFSQKPTIELTFTAIDSASYIQLDSIKVMNLTQGGDTVLYWPDTVLVLNYQLGITETNNGEEKLQVLPNYPNPVKDQTTITLYVPEKGKISVMISDMLGREVINTERVLERGYHSFKFTPGSGEIFFFTAFWQENSSSIKILQIGSNSGGQASLEYLGSDASTIEMKGVTAVQSFNFDIGDELLYIGYTGTLQSGILDAPASSETYTLQFATNIPCPGTPTVTYEGQVYNTIQIFSQCWLKENLNVGLMIQSAQSQTNNDTIEKYCIADNEPYCDIVGGLYFWDEMMKYTNGSGGQGICPEGWHIPDDLDWQLLEGAVDSEYKIGDPEWANNAWRGADAGGNLKQTGTASWEPPNTGATDAFGFTALPGGYFIQNAFWGPGYKAYFWSSDNEEKYFRNIDWNEVRINKNTGGDGMAFSVRCIRDY
jgi:uncharacterized protein (TIGR02145 family)